MIDYGYGVRMRRIDERDLAFLFVSRNNPEVYKWCRQNSPLHWESHQEWFKWQRTDPDTEMFTVISDNGPIGAAGLTSIDKVNGRAEFSLYIAQEHWGNNYGSQALKTLFAWGFGALRLNRVWGESFDGNPAIDLFKSLGMEFEGVRYDYYFRSGSYVDAHLFSISSADFDHLHALDKGPGGGGGILKPVA